MNGRVETRLWLAQRISAMVLGVGLLIHLMAILFAMRGGLSAAEILSRTRGNWPLASFYGLLLVAAAVHAPIGLRVVLAEWFSVQGRATDWVLSVAGVALACWGLRAIWAVFFA